MKQVLLAGHSHAQCVALALKAKEFTPPDSSRYQVISSGAAGIPGGYWLTAVNGKDMLNPILLRHVQQALRRSKVSGGTVWFVSMFAGNDPVRMGMFRRGEDWQTLLPGERGKFDETRRFIPYDALRSALAKRLADFAKFSSLMAQFKSVRFLHVETPPPLQNPEAIVARLPQKAIDLACTSELGGIGAENIASSDFRRKLWICQSDVQREIVQSHGGMFLSAPKAAMEQGFLAERHALDATHATPAYGALVLDSIERLMDSLETKE